MEDIIDEPSQCWMPESILVLTGEGREPIDIVPYLINKQDDYASLKNERKRIEFPADVFPPSWDNRKVIESAVKAAAAESGNSNLIIMRTLPRVKYPTTVLACDMSVSYRAPKNANDIQANNYENKDNLPRIDKPGVRQDNRVNENMANRKDGRSQPRCTYTEKPAPGKCCPFCIRILLDPGNCWFLLPWAGCRSHNHKKHPSDDKRRRLNTWMNTCTDKERKDNAIHAHQGSAGVAAGIVREQSGNHFSETQMRHNKMRTDIQTGQAPPAPGPDDLHAISMESSDLYSSCRSVFGIVCEQARLSKSAKVESIIRHRLSEMHREVNEDLLRQQVGEQESSEFVSSHVPLDRRETSHRLKSASERKRRISSSGKGVRKPTRLNMGSVYPSDT